MMAIDRAIKARWAAAGLNSTLSYPWDGEIPEGTAFPYASIVTISDTPKEDSLDSSYFDKQVQFQVRSPSRDTAGYWGEQIAAGFLHADRKATSPLQISAADGTVKDVRIVGSPSCRHEGDGIYVSTVVVGIQYAKSSGLNAP